MSKVVVPEVNVPQRKKNHISKFGNAKQDEPASNPTQEILNLRRPSGQNSGKVKKNVVKMSPVGLKLQDIRSK